MIISFHKLNQKIDLNLNFDTLSFTGSIKKIDGFANLVGQFSGDIVLSCDICDIEFKKAFKETVNLKLTNKTIPLNDDLDIVECNNSFELNDILLSEIDAYKCDYHYCKKCSNI